MSGFASLGKALGCGSLENPPWQRAMVSDHLQRRSGNMADSEKENLLAELAALSGVEAKYYDIAGNLHVTTPETQAAILSAMGCQCENVADLREELEQRQRWPWTALLEPVLALCQAELPAAWNLYLPLTGGQLPADLELVWELFDEAGGCIERVVAGAKNLQVAEARSFGGVDYGRLAIPLPATLALGYYEIKVQVTATTLHQQGRTLLIIAPEQMYLSENLDVERLWGLNLQLYAVRSARNWGIGDCGDLQQLLAVGSRYGVDIIGLNPLHHLGVLLHDSISPYYPTSRRYPNPLYLDLERLAELAAAAEAREYLARPEVRAKLTSLR